MSASLSTWYHAQYASWNRTRRLHTAPFLATENSGPAAAAARLAAGDTLILNMNDVTQLMAANPSLMPEAPKKPDTLFGPGVGVIAAGPGWTDPKAQRCKDELTPEVVKNWVAKSKESSQPTTTLQALVNLKRPSIKLSPLSTADESDEAVHHQMHGLEFEFDCDAPKCEIKVHVLGAIETEDKLVFESTVDGGFGKTLKYDQGATLELEQFEMKSDEPEITNQPSASTPSVAAPLTDQTAVTPTDNRPTNRNRRRFSNFPFRKRADSSRLVAGPALQVVDADMPTSNATEETASPSHSDPKEKDDSGIKVTISLESLDSDGRRLPSRNSQVTYLHIVRVGSTDNEEDRRTWVVKVVKREATIGAHTFHLHEIYGLSSTSAPSAPPAATHAYPPVIQTSDDQTSECLLCLSSPREVVLLPCRHLVACKECAVNMVEFGAGGTLVHTENEPAPATPIATTNENGIEGAGNAEPSVTSPTGTNAAPVPSAARRKRKAKGWYCPVCRQPYTSLLRITTSPPEKDVGRSSGSQENVIASTEQSSHASANSGQHTSTATVPSTAEGRGLFGRPNFLRSLSRPTNRPVGATGSNLV